jgi:hypothetical protein
MGRPKKCHLLTPAGSKKDQEIYDEVKHLESLVGDFRTRDQVEKGSDYYAAEIRYSPEGMRKDLAWRTHIQNLQVKAHGWKNSEGYENVASGIPSVCSAILERSLRFSCMVNLPLWKIQISLSSRYGMQWDFGTVRGDWVMVDHQDSRKSQVSRQRETLEEQRPKLYALSWTITNNETIKVKGKLWTAETMKAVVKKIQEVVVK